MPDSSRASPLAELERSLAASRPDEAADAALRALRGGVPPVDVLRTTATASSSRYDPASGGAPHALAAIGAAIELQGVLGEPQRPLAVLQAVALAASEVKLPSVQPPPRVVSGEVTHLGRSALLAVRAGDLEDAEAVFLGIVEEGWERRMTGEVLFRASLEDSGDAGHKLLTSVAVWRLARALGFRDARTILRPAVQYLVNGESARGPFALVLSALGKETVDLETLVAGGRPLDASGRARLATALAAPTEDGCVAQVLDLLRGGYALASLAQGVGLEASKRLLAAEGYHPESIHAQLFAHAAEFVIEFSRSSDRVYALFAAALRVRSPAPRLHSEAGPPAVDAVECLRRIAHDLELRTPRESAADVRAYLDAAYDPKPLLALLAHRSTLDSAVANQGHNLLLADSCLAEYTASHAPEPLVALAKTLAVSPKDVTSSRAWTAALGL